MTHSRPRARAPRHVTIMHKNQHRADAEVYSAHRFQDLANLPGTLNTYSAIPIVSRQRLASIQVEAVSIRVAATPHTPLLSGGRLLTGPLRLRRWSSRHVQHL